MEIKIRSIQVSIDTSAVVDMQRAHMAMALAYRNLVWGTMGPFGENRPLPWAPLSKSYAKRVRPQVPTLYRTGRLANSIQVSADEQAGHVFTDGSAPYAEYHQYGTSKMPARLYFQFYPGSGAPTQIAIDTCTLAALDSIRKS